MALALSPIILDRAIWIASVAGPSLSLIAAWRTRRSIKRVQRWRLYLTYIALASATIGSVCSVALQIAYALRVLSGNLAADVLLGGALASLSGLVLSMAAQRTLRWLILLTAMLSGASIYVISLAVSS